MEMRSFDRMELLEYMRSCLRKIFDRDAVIVATSERPSEFKAIFVIYGQIAFESLDLKKLKTTTYLIAAQR